MGSLILCSELVLSGATLTDVLQTCTLDISSVSVLTNSQALTSAASWKASQYNTVVSLAHTPQHHNEQFIRLLASVVQPGGKLILRQAADAAGQAEPALRRTLLMSGLSPVDRHSSASEASSTVTVEAVKPQWQQGASQPIKLRKVGAAAAGPAAKAAPVRLWGGALELDDDELVDDEDLLTEEDMQRPSVPVTDDCGAGKKACKNCVCGRAEEEAAGETRPVQKLTTEMLENPGAVGGCGSCSLGDAFRCGTCPYRGLPAFQPGKKIELGADYLTVDA